MKRNSSAKIILALLTGILIVLLAILTVLPTLNELLAVEVATTEQPLVTKAPAPEKPEEVPVTVYYVMEENAKKLSAIYIEVFPVGGTAVYYMEIPVDTKVNLSEALYKSLQTYAPELPQYLKLSNMAEAFSKEYALTGCNRILSEALGLSLQEYVCADSAAMTAWMDLQTAEKTANVFFADYTKWLEQSSSSRTIEERWMYYESRRQVTDCVKEVAPGSQEKDGYLISGKRSKERLEELILRKEIIIEQEESVWIRKRERNCI